MAEVAEAWREVTSGMPCPTCGGAMSGDIGERVHVH